MAFWGLLDFPRKLGRREQRDEVFLVWDGASAVGSAAVQSFYDGESQISCVS